MLFTQYAEFPLLVLGGPGLSRLTRPPFSFTQEQVNSRRQVKTTLAQLFRTYFRRTHTCEVSMSGEYQLDRYVVNDGFPSDPIPVDFKLRFSSAEVVHVRDAGRDGRVPEFSQETGWQNPGPPPDPRQGTIRYGAALAANPLWVAYCNVRVRAVDVFVGEFFHDAEPSVPPLVLDTYFLSGPSSQRPASFRRVGVAATFASWNLLLPMTLFFGIQPSFFDPSTQARDVYPNYFLGGAMDGFRPFSLGWAGDVNPLPLGLSGRSDTTFSLKALGREIPARWVFFPVGLSANFPDYFGRGSASLNVEWKEGEERPL